ncbi:unnamed protein product [Brugia pahangi]|uniref:TetR family transcriptional regulator n=1 Tax=Brugia pahangi TaxID=6280 RepID=A0A0N4T2J6_BRUPA|nr:unnamed protein product [Brugia pahangi]
MGVYMGLVAQWITRRSTEPKIAGSTPAEGSFRDLVYSLTVCLAK